MIAAIVDERKPSQGEKGQYGYIRQPEPEEKPKRSRTKTRKQGATIETNADPNEASTSTPSNYAVDAPHGSELQPPSHKFLQDHASPDSSQLETHSLHAPGEGPLNPGSQDATVEEEMDDADEDPDFVVRVGHEPPPKWGKRKVSDSFDADAVSKRRKPEYVRVTYQVEFADARFSRNIVICHQALHRVRHVPVRSQIALLTTACPHACMLLTKGFVTSPKTSDLRPRKSKNIMTNVARWAVLVRGSRD